MGNIMRDSKSFTSEIIQSSLQAIAAEMFDAMRVTAMSPIIYEVLDLGRHPQRKRRDGKLRCGYSCSGRRGG